MLFVNFLQLITYLTNFIDRNYLFTMKKNLLVVLITLFVAFLSQANAQTSPNDSQEKLRQKAIEAQKKKQKSAQKANSGPVYVNSSKQVPTTGNFQLDENDPYQGRKQEFLSKIILSELPADFPKYEKWMGVRNYNQIIDDYFKNHLDILKDRVKKKYQGK